MIYEKVKNKLTPKEQKYLDDCNGTNHKAFLKLCEVIEEELAKMKFLSEKDMEI
jgi:hypothetical protein